MNIRNSLWLALVAVQAFGTAACSASEGQGERMQPESVAAPMAQNPTDVALAQRRPAGARAVQIMDPTGFGQPMVAAVAEVPGNWRTEGGVGWNRETNCVTNQLQLAWRATSPDGAEAVEILPGFNWQVQGTQVSMNPCPAMPFASTRDFLQAVVQQNRPGARVLQYRDRPELVQTSAQSAPNAQVRQEAGQILIAYMRDGREFRESLGTSVSFSSMSGNVVAGTSMVFAQRAPAGALDFALGDRIAASIRPNPQWLKMIRNTGESAIDAYSKNQSNAIAAWNNAEMARINARGAADLAAISANTMRDVGAINAQTHVNTVATDDQIQAQNLESIGEYDRYRGVDGGAVRSSIHGGDRVLQMQNGDAFSTNDPYLHPTDSTELERVP